MMLKINVYPYCVPFPFSKTFKNGQKSELHYLGLPINQYRGVINDRESNLPNGE